MLMALGPFRFSIPTYSVEEIQRRVRSRIASQEVIGARPPTHLLGPDEETIALQSTFHPLHLNRGGIAQLEGVRAACIAQRPLMMVSMAGAVFGRWVIASVDDQRSLFHARSGLPQTVTVDMELVRYVGRGGFSLF